MHDDRPPVLATTPADEAQTRWAVIIALGLLAALIVTLPFGHVRLPRSYLFAPIVQTAILVVDLVTAVLIYAQFSVVRSRGLLVLAGGCIFTAFIMVPHTAAFVRIFADPPPAGAELDLAVWLYLFWHAGLPFAVIGYVALNVRSDTWAVQSKHVPLAIAASIAASVLAVGALVWLVRARYLPTIMTDPVLARSAAPFIPPAILSATAIGLLWYYRRSVLDVWLLVMLWAWLVDTLLQTVAAERFSVGWYSGRVYGLISATTILIVLLVDATALNARLVVMAMARRRESANRAAIMEAMAASITHEIRQPLTTISLDSSTGVAALQKSPPDFEGARASLDRIGDNVERAGQIMNSVRAMFVKGGEERKDLDCNELLRGVLLLLQNELVARKIAVQLDLDPKLPLVPGNKTQLQQVMLNLLTNAADAMSTITGRPNTLSVSSTVEGRESVLLSVQDTGVGIDPEALEQIFEAFFTTKQTGMGMGLAISRWIVTSHGGQLWASRNRPCGTTFFLRLPIKAASEHSWREPALEGRATEIA